MGVTWASLGVLTATVFGMFFYLGSKMDAQRTELRSEIGEVRIDFGSRSEALGDRLDGVNARLDGVNARLDGVNARFDTHIGHRHAG